MNVDALRDEWERAIAKDRHADAAKALAALEQAEPGDPQWSQRLGDALRRLGKAREAEAAFERATRRYAAKGFMPKAIAMAKLVLALNPARTDVLASLEVKPETKAPPPLRPPPPVEPAPLSVARDSLDDEVRFADEPRSSILIEVEEVVELSVEEEGPPAADYRATMASVRLLSGLPEAALATLAADAELVEVPASGFVMRRGEPADALFAIVEGAVLVALRDGSTFALGDGDVVGEGCLLDEAERQADVRALRPTMLLCVRKETLDRAMAAHPEVLARLFDLLARRLVSNLVGTAPLFAAFEPDARLSLARLFEVRRAPAGTVLAARGRRSDGLYVLVAGHLEAASGDGASIRVARGSSFGHGSLLGGRAAAETVTAVTESLVLRLPAAKFATLAALYPPALAHLAEILDEPLRASLVP
jgi:CRP-like cAMP-binding protein